MSELEEILSKYKGGVLTVGECCQVVNFHPDDVLGNVYGYQNKTDSVKSQAWWSHQIDNHVITNMGFINPNYTVVSCVDIDNKIESLKGD